MLIDSHCHFNLSKVSPQIWIEEAKKNNVHKFLNVSVDIETFPEILNLAEQHKEMYASVGVHPNADLHDQTSVEDLIQLSQHPKVIAIGETGLDYYRSSGDLSWQFKRFRNHIQAAKETKKPLIIHCREAKEDVLKILKEENAKEIGGIMHCFVENWDIAQQVMDLGFLISFSGIVTFKTATDLQEVAQKVPANQYLIETDAPFLTPLPFRGKPNQPAYVKQIGEFIAVLRNESLNTVAQNTTQNFLNLFQLTA
jgi:TatD DNase family protein